jgi:hypothetical protein
MTRQLLIAAWSAIRARARAVGLAVPPRVPEVLPDRDLIENVRDLERAIVRSARAKGDAAWPSQNAS